MVQLPWVKRLQCSLPSGELIFLENHENVSVKKAFIETMFGIMMPRGSKKLKLSNMNMMGMGR